ncbi:unnamed protein product [marine sediment metagenome]|uniref:Uncharacterized protein n=1 Tax=marine sediment metagenome TaxID=412755 RepID=X1THB4_9ZZZZ
MPNAEAYAEIAIPVDFTLGDLNLSATSFMCKSTGGNYIPYFVFCWDNPFPPPTGEGAFIRINNDAAPSAGYGEWAKFSAGDYSGEWQREIYNDDWSLTQIPDWWTLEQVWQYFGFNTVDTVLVGLSGLEGPITAYVDDITINGITYNLE